MERSVISRNSRGLTRITHGFLPGIKCTKPDAIEFGLPINIIPAPETVVIHKSAFYPRQSAAKSLLISWMNRKFDELPVLYGHIENCCLTPVFIDSRPAERYIFSIPMAT
jgi:hypothetical protein